MFALVSHLGIGWNSERDPGDALNRGRRLAERKKVSSVTLQGVVSARRAAKSPRALARLLRAAGAHRKLAC